MDKFAYLQDELNGLENRDLLRKLRCVSSVDGPVVTLCGDERPKVNFCSNNYLNIASDPLVISAVVDAVGKWGFGSTASRLICGTMQPHVEVEWKFADFLGTEAALLFPSGWMANEALLTTLPQKGDIVLIDRADHASIIDATKSSNAEFRTYRRDNPAKLEKLLGDDKYNRKFIVTESIFSMDGDAADLAKLVELKNAFDAILIVDEAHSFGCMGATGTGLAEELGLGAEIDIIVAPLGKAAGASGAIAAAGQTVIDYLTNKARPFIYTTAPPAVNCAAAIAALEIIRNQPQRRKKLGENAQYLRQRLGEMKLDTADSCSHIIPVIIGDSASAVAVSKGLYERGYLVVAIRPPTVPKGSARLRISVQAEHTRAQLDGLSEALSDVMKSHELLEPGRSSFSSQTQKRSTRQSQDKYLYSAIRSSRREAPTRRARTDCRRGSPLTQNAKAHTA
jgi:8-amino-7-oxononanoate synthase